MGKNKFDAVHIANSTLAGGVAVGASARLDMGGGAVLLGVLAGTISVIGYFFVSQRLDEWLAISDTCGVHNLHGLPAILGGLASAVFVVVDKDADFLSYSGSNQAWRQVVATVATTALAVASGYLTGFVLKCTMGDEDHDDWFPEYDDSVYWWEGEFYENVNTVEDLKPCDDRDSTHHDLSLSKGTQVDQYNSYMPRTPHPLLNLDGSTPVDEESPAEPCHVPPVKEETSAVEEDGSVSA